MDTFVFYGFLALMGLFVFVLLVRTNRLLNAEAKLLLREQNKLLKKVPQEFKYEVRDESGKRIRQGRLDLIRWAQETSSINIQDLTPVKMRILGC